MTAVPTFQPETPEPLEVVAGRYEIMRRLARGGMGEVFACRDRSTGSVVALKRLLAAASAHPGAATHFARRIADAAAERVRMLYHLRRGDLERASITGGSWT